MQKLEKFYTPISILLMGLMVSGSILYVGYNSFGLNNIPEVEGNGEEIDDTAYLNVLPVSTDDHILGKANAKIKIVEFSDFQCPFCAKFHPDIKKVVEESNGEIALVYRHYPLNFHNEAKPAAMASECVAKLGGNDAFWKFGDKVFSAFESGAQKVDFQKLAIDSGVDAGGFKTCMDSGETGALVDEDIADATKSGLRGTPYSVILVDGTPSGIINGAQPYESIKQTINSVR